MHTILQVTTTHLNLSRAKEYNPLFEVQMPCYANTPVKQRSETMKLTLLGLQDIFSKNILNRASESIIISEKKLTTVPCSNFFSPNAKNELLVTTDN
jgi:hypothetical protein